jgi:hypothetical protein
MSEHRSVRAEGIGDIETVSRLVAGASRAEYRDSMADLAGALSPPRFETPSAVPAPMGCRI